jgi:hypothetical protein
MRKRDWDLLFSEYDMRAVLEAQLNAVNDRVVAIDRQRFDNRSDEMLAAEIASELVVEPLVLHEEDISVSSNDVKVDVSQEFDRAIRDRSQPFLIDGIEVTYHVPYSGDRELLKSRPSTFTMNPPRAVIENAELRFPYDRGGRDIAATKPLFTQDLSTLKQWIPWVNQQVNEYNGALEATVKARVQQRRNEIKRADEDLGSLGFRVRTAESNSATSSEASVSPEKVVQRRAKKRERARRTYDVALSFAGENRDYVEQVAEALKALDVTVFYDRFEQAHLWGKDLAEHLGDVYGKDSRFVILFASREYAAKAWPNHEKRFALSRQLADRRELILPVRFDDTEIPGIPATTGYIDSRVITPQKLAELIRQKVDEETSSG